MFDLINRQDAIDAIEKLISARYGWKTDAIAEIQGLNAAYCAIIDLPSAEPVTYCKDCFLADLCAWRIAGAEYCSYAERRPKQE